MSSPFDELVDRTQSDSIKWLRYPPDVLPMWVADMDFRSPEPVTRALAERVAHGVYGYAKEPPDLRGVVVERLQRLYSWQVAPESLVFVPGVVVGFDLAARAFVPPGDGLLMQTPVYFPILHVPETFCLRKDESELMQLPDGRYIIDFDSFKQAIDERTKLFILCNPHNPVGRVFRRRELEQMAEICLHHDVLICSDEIHCDLTFSGVQHIPIASLSPEISSRSVTLMAPSKTFNIAGFHCSVAIIPNAELRKRFQAARAGLVGGPDFLSYTAALAAYRHGGPWLEQLIPYLEANRDFLVDFVDEHLPGVTMPRPEGTYLAWLDFRQAGLPAAPYEFFLNEAKVAMNDGLTFGRAGDGFLRLNFGCPRSMLEDALGRMQDAMRRAS